MTTSPDIVGHLHTTSGMHPLHALPGPVGGHQKGWGVDRATIALSADTVATFAAAWVLIDDTYYILPIPHYTPDDATGQRFVLFLERSAAGIETLIDFNFSVSIATPEILVLMQQGMVICDTKSVKVEANYVARRHQLSSKSDFWLGALNTLSFFINFLTYPSLFGVAASRLMSSTHIAALSLTGLTFLTPDPTRDSWTGGRLATYEALIAYLRESEVDAHISPLWIAEFIGIALKIIREMPGWHAYGNLQ